MHPTFWGLQRDIKQQASAFPARGLEGIGEFY